ncbi:MAG: hypothetical protein KDD40_05880 [Bdellovibrionales bacterium]|nr:hypothetical protein [Bdellovibrionales bacterium]
MKHSHILLNIFISSVIFWGCGPRDVHVKNIKQRLKDGEVIVFDKAGDRSPTCFKDRSDWQDLYVHQNDYDSFVLNDFQSSMKNGYQNCYRVGSRVYIDSNRKALNITGSLGYAEVTGIALMSMEQLQKEEFLVAKAAADKANFSATVKRLQNSHESKHQGIVNVTFVKYITGSSVKEAELHAKQQIEKDLVSELLAGEIVTINVAGERLPSCGVNDKTWEQLRITSDVYEKLQQSVKMIVIQKGIKNCHQVGQIARVSVRDLPGNLGSVKIYQLQLMSLSTLKNKKDSLVDQNNINNFAQEISKLDEALKNEKNKLVSLTYVEFLGVQ